MADAVLVSSDQRLEYGVIVVSTGYQNVVLNLLYLLSGFGVSNGVLNLGNEFLVLFLLIFLHWF